MFPSVLPITFATSPTDLGTLEPWEVWLGGAAFLLLKKIEVGIINVTLMEHWQSNSQSSNSQHSSQQSCMTPLGHTSVKVCGLWHFIALNKHTHGSKVEGRQSTEKLFFLLFADQKLIFNDPISKIVFPTTLPYKQERIFINPCST